MITLTQLEYILAVDKERHFGRAARACHVAQPSLSMQIRKMEEDLNVILFDRSKSPVVPTSIGIEILHQAEIVLKEHSKLGPIANSASLNPRGNFHLAVIPTLAPYLIPLFVGEFSKSFPEVNLTISENQTEDILKLLADDKIDAGLLVTPLHDDQVIERHLFFEPFYAYISKHHALSSKKLLSEADLDDESLWILEEGHCFRDQVLKICSFDRKNRTLKNVEFSSGNLETLKNLVRKNSGYTLLPELALQDMSKNELSQHIRKFRKPVPTREVSLAHSRSFLKEPILNALEEIIIKKIPKNIRSYKKKDLEVVEIL